MKTIKKGRAQKGWVKEIECTGKGNGEGGCGSILLVEEGDFYNTYNEDYGGGREIYTTFECCECGVQTDVNIPSSVRVRKTKQDKLID